VVVKVRNAGVETLVAAKKVADLPREKPQLAALLSRAQSLIEEDAPAAKKLYDRIVELFPDDATGLNDAAWFLLTAKDAKLRDPRRALPIARKAVELSKEEQGNILDTLAVALHDTGDLAGAVKYSKMAAGKEPANDEIVQRAKDYAAEAAKKKEGGGRQF
jgi:tetratricopeptide (TPR) repeat protein